MNAKLVVMMMIQHAKNIGNEDIGSIEGRDLVYMSC